MTVDSGIRHLDALVGSPLALFHLIKDPLGAQDVCARK